MSRDRRAPSDTPEASDGIDRGQIRGTLRMSLESRLASSVNISKLVASVRGIAVLDPEALFGTFDRNGVEYVLVGGLAVVLHGSALGTLGADVCPVHHDENLENLARALHELGVASFDVSGLRQTSTMHLRTRAGDVGVYFEPAGGGFALLVEHAVDFDVYGVRVRVAALNDIIKSKQTANRLKDQAALPHLYALEDEIAAIERERRR